MICISNYISSVLENKDLTEPLLLVSQEEDRIDMGAEAHTSFLQHLREIRQQAEKEFGAENIFSETEAQDVMIGVEYLLLLFTSILNFKILKIS